MDALWIVMHCYHYHIQMITRFIGFIKEKMKNETEFSNSGKERVAMRGEISLCDLDICDDENDGEGDEDDGDGDHGVKMIDSVKLSIHEYENKFRHPEEN